MSHKLCDIILHRTLILSNINFATRERSNKVSSIMGQYMLKGYRMLDKQCPICFNVLLQTPAAQGATQYCVSCIDLGAATATVKEPPKKVSKAKLKPKEKPTSMASGDGPLPAHEPVATPAATKTTATTSCAIEEGADALEAKIAWAASELNASSSIAAAKELVGLMKECSEALLSLKQHL